MAIKNKQLMETIKEVVKKQNERGAFKNTSVVVEKLKRPEVKELEEEERRKYSVKVRKRSDLSRPLRRIRVSRGLTLEDLANMTKMSTSYISRIEGGSRRLNSDIIKVLSEALDCRPGDLLDFDGTGSQETSAVDNVVMSSGDVRASAAVNTNTSGIAKDLPMFSLKSASFDKSTVSDWVVRPYELNGDKDAYAVIIKDDLFEPRYKNMEMLFVSTVKCLTENCSVLALKKDGSVVLGDYLGWSVSGDSSAISDEDELSIKSYSSKERVVLKRENISSLHRIIGTMES